MTVDDCFQLGYIVKTHGLNGELVAQLDSDSPERYSEMEAIFLERSGNLFPFFVSTIKISGNRALIKLEDISDKDAAQELVGCLIFLSLEDLPVLENGQFYYHDLIGCQVFEKDRLLGDIRSMYQTSGKTIAGVDQMGNEILIPVEKEFILKVDLDSKRVEVNLPDGFLEVFTN